MLAPGLVAEMTLKSSVVQSCFFKCTTLLIAQVAWAPAVREMLYKSVSSNSG